MAWALPPTFATNNVLTAAQMNLIGDDLVYLKGLTDFLCSVGGQTTQTVTIAPVGGNAKFCLIYGYVWDETNVAVLGGALINTNRQPGGASIVMTTGGNTVTIVFNANGSITASRTAGTITWGLRLLTVYG